jgi:hypothetical protein
MAAVVYALSGWIWVEWVLISGIWANFFGALASLFLVAAAVRYARRPAPRAFLLLAAALAVAAFSHYSTLMVFPPLAGYLLWKRSWLGAAAFVVPVAAGALLFPSLVHGLLGFLQPTTQVTPQSSPLPPSSLGALDAELTGPEFAFLMLGASAFAWLSVKKRSPEMLMVLAWFVLPLAAAPWNSSAWRFAFVSLVPGTLMLGYVLSLVPKSPLTTRRGVEHRNLYRTLALVCLVVSPVFYPSWGYLALSHSFQAYPQQGVYDSLLWMGSHLQPNYTAQGPTGPYPVCYESPQNPRCPHVVSVDDWRLTYSPLFGGPDVLYAPDYGVVWEDPFQTQLFALQHNSTYMAVSRYSTFPLPACDPRYSFGLTLSADATSAPPGGAVTLTLGASGRINATVDLYDDGTKAASVQLTDGQATLRASFSHAGNHSLIAAIGTTATSPLVLVIGPSAASGTGPSTVTVPQDFCQPWYLYNPATMAAWSVVYQNSEVVIWGYGK